jgi:hypothetical protein
MDALGLDANVAELKRAALRDFGFVRMTSRTADYLNECICYTWTLLTLRGDSHRPTA